MSSSGISRSQKKDPDLFFNDPGKAQGTDEDPPDPLPDVVGEVLNGQSEMNNTLEAFSSIKLDWWQMVT